MKGSNLAPMSSPAKTEIALLHGHEGKTYPTALAVRVSASREVGGLTVEGLLLYKEKQKRIDTVPFSARDAL